MTIYQSQSTNQKFGKSIAKGLIVWQSFQAIDSFSVSPYSTGTWFFESLAISIIFSILLKKPTDLAYGVAIAAYAASIDRFSGILLMLYLMWSFYRLDKHHSEENGLTSNTFCSSNSKPAGTLRRAAAYLIDLLILMLLLIPFSISVGGLASNTRPLNPYHQWINVFIALAFWLVLAAMESSVGATLGKKAMGLSVVNVNGEKLTFGAALMRNFIKVPLWTVPIYLFPDMDIMALLLSVGQIGVFSFSAFTEKHQALYDVLANSIVLRYSPALRETPESIVDSLI